MHALHAMALPQPLLGLLVPGHVMAWLAWGSASTCLVEPEAEAEDSHDARIGLSRLKAALASETDGKHGKQGLVVPGQRCRAGCGQAWCRAGGGGWAE